MLAAFYIKLRLGIWVRTSESQYTANELERALSHQTFRDSRKLEKHLRLELVHYSRPTSYITRSLFPIDLVHHPSHSSSA